MAYKLSVILPVYNAEKYVESAIQSIVNQSFKDFELILINDGSSDKSARIMQRFANKDTRIKFISRENRGLVFSLNEGIALAKGEYIARHDADDISTKNRFKKQIEFLDRNQDTVIVGSSISVINEQGVKLHEHRLLLNDPELRHELMVRSPFAHGSVMFRKASALSVGGYDQNYWPAEDYEFWLRLSRIGKLANIDSPLYFYREHGQSISSSNENKQQAKSDIIRHLAWTNARQLMRGHISVSNYRHLVHSEHRTSRLLSNIESTIVKSIQDKKISTTYKLLTLPGFQPTLYRKLLGRIKRKVMN